MIHLTLRSEFSFKKCFGHIKTYTEIGLGDTIGIADEDNTFGHVRFYNECMSNDIKPILGVRLMVLQNKPEPKKKAFGPRLIFLAKNMEGLQEIYRLVECAWERFYYHPFLIQNDLDAITPNVFVIANSLRLIDPKRVDYVGLCAETDPLALRSGFPLIHVDINRFPRAQDSKTYELMLQRRDRMMQTYPQHILRASEVRAMFPELADVAMSNGEFVAEQCNVKLPWAENVIYNGDETVESWCLEGLRDKGIDLDDEIYMDRLDRELKLINDKGFTQYFLVVADMMRFAKKKMLVGPARGSSCGSLVCYLMGINSVDPIRHGLLFERFIDENRSDIPDIDIDFPDSKRHLVVKYLEQMYGKENVHHIGTVLKFQTKSALQNVAMSLGVPEFEMEDLKSAMPERKGGDARASMRINDTFETTDVGKEFLERYPKMIRAAEIEGHAMTSGKHAAGILITNDALTNYAGINTRDGVVMVDKKDAEKVNLLKIDCLGLRTLSILEDVMDAIGMDRNDLYDLPLDDEPALNVFREGRMCGVFQFDGHALRSVSRQIEIKDFYDLVALTTLARPGPIHSGGASTYLARHSGTEEIEYLSEHESVIKHTEQTYGVIIFQEQLMMIGREYGGLAWKHVQAIRRASSKSLGADFFNEIREHFVEGAIAKGQSEEEANYVFDRMIAFGNWGMNKSHAVAYGIISYWTAYMKAHHPLEFAMANLNHAQDEEQAMKLLREMVRFDGIKYSDVDPDESLAKWSIRDGELLCGLENIPGIGEKKAIKVLQARKDPSLFTPGLIDKLVNAETAFGDLFPCERKWGEMKRDYQKFGLDKKPINIEHLSEDNPGEYILIGKMVSKNVRDMNEYTNVMKRGGTLIDGPQYMLNIRVEDDTDTIICTIDRFNYERIGRDVAETGKEGTSWYLIKGKIIKGRWRKIHVGEILDLDRWQAKTMMEETS